MLGVAEGVNEIEGNSRSRERERERENIDENIAYFTRAKKIMN